MRYFMTHPGEVLSQERLLEHVWDEMVDPFTNTARVTVGTLRRKLSAVAGAQLIETVIGSGYRLRRPGAVGSLRCPAGLSRSGSGFRWPTPWRSSSPG